MKCEQILSFNFGFLPRLGGGTIKGTFSGVLEMHMNWVKSSKNLEKSDTTVNFYFNDVFLTFFLKKLEQFNFGKNWRFI